MAEPSKQPHCNCRSSRSAPDIPRVDLTRTVFFSFSAINGRTAELVRFSLPTNREDWEWQLSPDGSRVAVLVPSEGRVHLIALESPERTEIPLNNFASAYHL